jgi:hypothetical protein
MKLADEKYQPLFKMLSTKTLYETGLEFGLDKHYKDSRAVNNAVYVIYKKVLAQPEKYGVQPETVELVKAVVSQRAVATSKKGVTVTQETTLREKLDTEANPEFKDLVLSGRKKAFQLLNMKMDRVMKSNKGIDEVGITALAQTFGILFDKAQIIQGEATENVAIMARIDRNMSSEDALASILKMREVNNIEKDRVTKKK